MANILNILKSINTLSSKSKFCKSFIIDGCQVGLVRQEVSENLQKYPEVFIVSPTKVSFINDVNSYEKRTEAMEGVLKNMKRQGAFSTLAGWRNEYYEVKANFDSKPFFKMDRCSTCLFGIKNYGINLNGYVNHPTKGLCLWLQKRSSKKQRWPGFWDIMVGGGISVGQGILETVYLESSEEASVPIEFHKDIISAGTTTCLFENEQGIFPQTAFVFDLLLPLDFEPKNIDGEVDEFRLVTVRECLNLIETGLFKTSIIMVAVDFLVRHSLITPYGNPYYVDIVEMLHLELQNLYQK